MLVATQNGGVGLIKVYPKFEEDLLVRLFHKGIKAQWSADDVSWDDPLLFSPAQSQALARMLTPVYLGEQSAMIGASVVLPQMAAAGETTAQLYLSSFLMDEARHFEVLTQLYRRLGTDPLTIREMPEMLRYHNRLRKGDRIDWVWGILISDIFAKNFYQVYAKSQPEALFGKLSGRILRDESRHQAFAEHYLKNKIPVISEERRAALMDMKDDLLFIMDAMYARLGTDAAEVGMDGRLFLDHLSSEIEQKARRIGLDPEHHEPGYPNGVKRFIHGVGTGLRQQAQDLGTKFQGLEASRDCDTCFLSLLCQSNLFLRARCV